MSTPLNPRRLEGTVDVRGRGPAQAAATRAEFLRRAGAASALAVVGGGLLPREAAAQTTNTIYFYNSGVTSGWDFLFNTGQNGSTRSYAVTQRSDDPRRSSNWALRFETRFGDPDDGGRYHSEVIENNAGRRGLTRWYGWSTYVPSDWVDDDNEVITQQVIQSSPELRDQPVAFLAIQGTRWIYYNRYNTSSGGIDFRTLDLGPVQKGQWTDWVVQAKWSSGSDGFIKVWKYNNTTPKGQILDAPTIFANDLNLSFRVGCYASGWVGNDGNEVPPGAGEARTRALRQDEVRLGNSGATFDEVKPR